MLIFISPHDGFDFTAQVLIMLEPLHGLDTVLDAEGNVIPDGLLRLSTHGHVCSRLKHAMPSDVDGGIGSLQCEHSLEFIARCLYTSADSWHMQRVTYTLRALVDPTSPLGIVQAHRLFFTTSHHVIVSGTIGLRFTVFRV